MIRSIGLIWLCGVAAVSGAWYFEAGPWYRGGMRIDVEGGTRAAETGAYAARAGVAGGRSARPATLLDDDGTGQVLRTFDDGFVGPSGFGWAQEEGATPFWGYETAGQYDAGSHTLMFSLDLAGSDASVRTETRITAGEAGWRERQRVSGAGARATLGRVLRQGERLTLSLQGTFGVLKGIDARFRGREAYRQDWTSRTIENTRTQTETWTYVYDTLDNPAFPPAPYAMEDPEGVGPMIADTPEEMRLLRSTFSAADRLLSVRRDHAVSRVDLEVSAALWVLQLGPRVSWRSPGAAWHGFVQPGVTVHLMDIRGRRRETFTKSSGAVIGEWHDRVAEQAWLWGAGVSGGVQWNVSERIYMAGVAGYDVVERHTMQVGPDRARLDIGGYRADLAIGLLFGGRK